MLRKIWNNLGMIVFFIIIIVWMYGSPLYLTYLGDKKVENWNTEHACQKVELFQTTATVNDNEIIKITWTKTVGKYAIYDIPTIDNGRYTDQNQNTWEIVQYDVVDEPRLCQNVHTTP